MIFASKFDDIPIPTNKTSFSAVFQDGKLDKPKKVALIDGISGEKITFETLYNSICAFSAALNNLGFRKGQVLAIFSPNSIEYPICMFGASRAGLSVTTANPGYISSEFAYQLKDSEASVIFCHPSVLKETISAVKESQISTQQIYTLGKEKVDGFRNIYDLIEMGKSFIKSFNPPSYTESDIQNNPAYLCYSSGTTGRSKGVVTTHYNMVSNILQYGPFEEKTNDNVVHIAVLPFYHIYGLNLFLHVALYRSETLVVMPKFDLVQFLELIQRYRVTHANIVPPIAIGLAKHPIVSKYDISSLKHVLSGAAPLGEDVSLEFTERLNIPIKQAYGMTETSPLALYTPKKEIVIGSCGILAPNMQAKIIDESGKLLGYGQRGELCLQGPNIMKGYLKNDRATKETLIDGWLHTGDVAIVQPNGYYFIVDRIKELIKYKGLQVVPAELESYLLGHPKIADAAVIPKSDAVAGEFPKAFVVLKAGMTATASEIQDYIAGKTSHHKHLRGGVEFIQEIPKSASGKILRRILRDKESQKAKL